ncbi:MAG TPA: DUF2167 domain-containing protein [Vitreimonas sp.]|nr:DUF2167 domain-containing protein [Vitreimonas sp.]
MRKKLACAWLSALVLLGASPAFADGRGDPGPDRAAPPVRAAPVQPATDANAPPQGQSGIIPLNDGGMTLNVPDGYRFYSAEEAQRFMLRNNASAPDGVVVGLLARAGDDIRADGTWATVISYDAIGYVQPETAAGLSDANFETSVRDARTTQNRAFEGFVAPPAFDAAAPNLVWAERSAVPGAGGKDLRFEQKVLGRNGVACMTSIGSADQLDDITAAADELRGMLSFSEGQRHADFQPASDRVSAYSVPGLVTGVPNAQPQAVADAASTGAGQTAFGGLAGWFPWVAFGVVVLAIVGFVMMRRRRDDAEPA